MAVQHFSSISVGCISENARYYAPNARASSLKNSSYHCPSTPSASSSDAESEVENVSEEEPLEPPESLMATSPVVDTTKLYFALSLLHPSLTIPTFPENEFISDAATQKTASKDSIANELSSCLEHSSECEKKKGLFAFIKELFSPKLPHDNEHFHVEKRSKKCFFHYGGFESLHQHLSESEFATCSSAMMNVSEEGVSVNTINKSASSSGNSSSVADTVETESNTNLRNTNAISLPNDNSFSSNLSRKDATISDASINESDFIHNGNSSLSSVDSRLVAGAAFNPTIDTAAEMDNSKSTSLPATYFTTIPTLKPLNGISSHFNFSSGKIIGKGGSGTVRLVKSPCCNSFYAVKEFKKKKRKESEADFVKRATMEYLIGSSLRHPNIAETIDMICKGSRWYQVMPYYDGGDLYSIIKSDHLTEECCDCVFKQLIYGVSFMHSKGIAHRDLKPENLLMDSKGFLKITDFGISDLFITSTEECSDCDSYRNVIPVIHKSKGLSGSTPYIAPEEFTCEEFDPRAVDVWSCAIIYYAMTFHSIPWEVANSKNPEYAHYLENRKLTEEPFVRFSSGPQHLLFKMLNPDPAQRITIDEILKNPWFQQIKLCVDYDTSVVSQTTECQVENLDVREDSEEPIQHFHFKNK